jgi:hypothetical protein
MLLKEGVRLHYFCFIGNSSKYKAMENWELMKNAMNEFTEIFNIFIRSNSEENYQLIIDRFVGSLRKKKSFWLDYFNLLRSENADVLMIEHRYLLGKYIHHLIKSISIKFYPNHVDEFVSEFEHKFYNVFNEFIVDHSDAYLDTLQYKLERVTAEL